MKEYILKSDLVEWMYTWFDCDGKKDEKVVRKAIIDKLPTHSFESLDEAKIADIVFEHAPNGATNCMKTAQAICQHFKKAEGDYPLVCMPRQFGKDTKSRILMQYNLERLGVGEKFLLLTPRGEYLFKKIPVPKKKPANIKIYYDEFVKVLDKESE